MLVTKDEVTKLDESKCVTLSMSFLIGMETFLNPALDPVKRLSNRCVVYNGLTKQPWLTEYRKMINPLGWRYYVEAIEREQLEEREEVGSPIEHLEDQEEQEQLVDMTDSQLIQLAEAMVKMLILFCRGMPVLLLGLEDQPTTQTKTMV